ncbi:MAG: DegV family EDD domain-containing protein [Clostridia bacterium]|nr:DegV family EDD domain-containing protein [Clostridia bacterium]
MRKIKIVSDSASDLTELKYADFAYAPMKLITDRKEFVDDDSLNVKESVDFFSEYKGKSQTSCPNTGDWIKAFGDADDIICVTITSGLSGSYNTACAAKKIYEDENEGKRVFVVDSLSAGPEITLLVKKLEECVASGMEYEEICRKIMDYRDRTGLLFILKSLKNFANNGRVSPALARIVEFLGICIIGRASEKGTLEPLHKCRGEARALSAVANDMEEYGVSFGKISIAHCENEVGALRLKTILQAKFKNAQIEIHKLRGLCSFYAEKGGILIGFEKNDFPVFPMPKL